MTTAVCPGSFDPVTLGHLDVIGRAAAVVDHLVVAVGRNSGKRSLFSVSERVAMLVEVCAPFRLVPDPRCSWSSISADRGGAADQWADPASSPDRTHR